MGRRVRDPRRAAEISAAGSPRHVTGEKTITRWLPGTDKTRELFGRVDTVSRFGTEGSEVQILSPRPTFPKKHHRIQSGRPLGFARVVSSSNRSSASLPAAERLLWRKIVRLLLG